MHFKNGRAAKNGDKVVLIPQWTDPTGKRHVGTPVIGILYDAQLGNDFCNGKLAPFSPSDPMPNLKDCLHLDDFVAAFPAAVPDTSNPPPTPADAA